MASVGIIANPAAGKDIRRLVAQGRFVPNQEKVNILKRILAGLDAAGVERVVMMPDMARLGNGALDGGKYRLDVSFADMIVFNAQRDSVRAAGIMAEMGVGLHYHAGRGRHESGSRKGLWRRSTRPGVHGNQ